MQVTLCVHEVSDPRKAATKAPTATMPRPLAGGAGAAEGSTEDGAAAGSKVCAGGPPPNSDSAAGEKGEPPGQLSGSGSSIGLNSACVCHRDLNSAHHHAWQSQFTVAAFGLLSPYHDPRMRLGYDVIVC